MPTYRIISKETVYYFSECEAENEDQAKEKVLSCAVDLTGIDGDDFGIVSVELADD